MRRQQVGEWTLWIPESRRERARGLLGRSGLEAHEGLLLERCRSVHTFGMRFDIDAVLLDRDRRPIGIRRMARRRLLVPRRPVHHIVEVAAGMGGSITAALDATAVRRA